MLLSEEIGKGGDFCGRVVKLAVEVANNIVLASFNTVQRIGLEVITLLHHDLIISADSACTVAHRGMQQLLDGVVASKDSSSTIDFSSAAAEHSSGTRSLHTPVTCIAAGL
jgi:cysteine sulfinate desulfinase/cysteine desulfurase-like protein